MHLVLRVLPVFAGVLFSCALSAQTVTGVVQDENGQPFTHRRLNPNYNPDTTYVPREDRSEWDCVGLMGKLRIRKGQITGSRWIKMRDVSDTVEEWLVR